MCWLDIQASQTRQYLLGCSDLGAAKCSLPRLALATASAHSLPELAIGSVAA